jgi:hypothetical protein
MANTHSAIGKKMTTATSTETELPPHHYRKLPYNDEERTIYRLLSANGPMTTNDVIEAIEWAGGEPTKRQLVLNRLSFLKHKLDFHGHSCGLTNSGMRGNLPTTWQLVARDRAETDRAIRAARIAQAKKHERWMRWDATQRVLGTERRRLPCGQTAAIRR